MDQVLLIVTGAVLAFAGAAATLLVGEIQAKRRRTETLQDTQRAWDRERQHERALWLRERRMDLYARYQVATETLMRALRNSSLIDETSTREDTRDALKELLNAQQARMELWSEVLILADGPIRKLMRDHEQALDAAFDAAQRNISEPDFESQCDETRTNAGAVMVALLIAIRRELGISPRTTR